MYRLAKHEALACVTPYPTTQLLRPLETSIPQLSCSRMAPGYHAMHRSTTRAVVKAFKGVQLRAATTLLNRHKAHGYLSIQASDTPNVLQYN